MLHTTVTPQLYNLSTGGSSQIVDPQRRRGGFCYDSIWTDQSLLGLRTAEADAICICAADEGGLHALPPSTARAVQDLSVTPSDQGASRSG